ncbi:MAG: CsbD family protein [Cereibacter sphaeroides]|uniref:CsbD family protein n=1 Tax=Cereibacter sphaeroides TaxID=1063 RepID=A0A2W5SKK9_CERSP|nr:MAG: CsbD family protein [Cereibacter sphaeroides]
MNWDQVAGTWKQYMGKAKAQWGEITDDEWTKAAGRRDEMVGLVQKRYGRAKDEAEREVDKWLAGL